MTSKSSLARFDASWKSWKLKNGLRCLHIPLPKGDERFHVVLVTHAGSRHESAENSGISHLLEHMMFRGSAKYPSFSSLSEAFENLGGEWNAATGHEYTEFFYSGTLDKARDAFELLSDFTLRPALQDLDTERRIVLRELEGELNENGVSTDVDFHILRSIWPKTSMALPIIGSDTSLEAIKLTHIQTWLDKHYHPKNMVLAVVGGKARDARALSKEFFHEFPKSRRKMSATDFKLPTFKGPYCELIENADNEYDVQVSFVCEGTNSPLTPAYDMLARILGDGFSSRLVKRIREELGLVYDISSGFQQYYNGGTFSINANISDANIEVFFAELFAILDQLSKGGPSKEELTRHHTRALTDLQLVPTDPSHVAFRLCWATLTSADPSLETWKNRMETTTAAQIQDTAKTLFTPENLSVVALGPRDEAIAARFNKAVFKWK